MNLFVTILLAILIFGVIIIIHELGHFLTAKAVGIAVPEFSIGMGPKLLQWEKGETKYTLRLLPIGGYVAMEGEDEESDNERAFCNKKAAAEDSGGGRGRDHEPDPRLPHHAGDCLLPSGGFQHPDKLL